MAASARPAVGSSLGELEVGVLQCLGGEAQLVEGGVCHDAPVGEDDDTIDALGDLGQKVARHERRAATFRERAERASQPLHPGGVKAVRRLIQREQGGFTEQGCGQSKALAHPERVGLDQPLPRGG